MDFMDRYSIEREMALYAETGRAIHAWRAYYWIRRAGLPVPPWFLEYLDGCADRLMGKDAPTTPQEVADVFEMGAKGRASTDCDRLAAVQEAHGLKKMMPEPNDGEIFKKVAKERGVSTNYVKNAYYDWFPKK